MTSDRDLWWRMQADAIVAMAPAPLGLAAGKPARKKSLFSMTRIRSMAFRTYMAMTCYACVTPPLSAPVKGFKPAGKSRAASIKKRVNCCAKHGQSL